MTADPGCGKSVLARSLVDDELRSCASSKTAYFFFKSDDEKQTRTTTALCALLHQILVQSHPSLQRQAVKTFEKFGNRLAESHAALWDLLMSLSRESEAGQIVCIVDALDECEKLGRDRLLIDLNNLYANSGSFCQKENTSRLKFLVTSRDYQSIRYQFGP